MENTQSYELLNKLHIAGVINPAMSADEFESAVFSWGIENINELDNHFLVIEDSLKYEYLYNIYYREYHDSFFTIREDRILMTELRDFLTKRYDTNRNYLYDMVRAGRLNSYIIDGKMYVDKHNAEKAITWAELKRKVSLPKELR